jgi:hypothetical protein
MAPSAMSQWKLGGISKVLFEIQDECGVSPSEAMNALRIISHHKQTIS